MGVQARVGHFGPVGHGAVAEDRAAVLRRRLAAAGSQGEKQQKRQQGGEQTVTHGETSLYGGAGGRRCGDPDDPAARRPAGCRRVR